MATSLKILALATFIACLGTSPVSAKNANGQGNGNGQDKSQKGKGHDKGGQQDMVYAGIDQKQAKKYAKQYKVQGYKTSATGYPQEPGARQTDSARPGLQPPTAGLYRPPAALSGLRMARVWRRSGVGLDRQRRHRRCHHGCLVLTGLLLILMHSKRRFGAVFLLGYCMACMLIFLMN